MVEGGKDYSVTISVRVHRGSRTTIGIFIGKGKVRESIRDKGRVDYYIGIGLVILAKFIRSVGGHSHGVSHTLYEVRVRERRLNGEHHSGGGRARLIIGTTEFKHFDIDLVISIGNKSAGMRGFYS